MKKEKKVSADCYSEKDRAMMEKSWEWREKCLKPVLIWLEENNFKPDTITLAALICGLIFVPLFIYSPLAAMIALLVHVGLDGLDGPLARYMKSDSAKGSLTDTLSDQIIVAATTATLIFTGYLHPFNGAIYVFLYTVVVTFAMIRNAMDIPYRFLVRPRFFVYLMIPVSVYFWQPALEYTVMFFNIPLLYAMISGYLKIRNQIANR